MDLRTTCIGSVLRDRTMYHSIRTLDNNNGMYLRAQERAHLRDLHSARGRKGVKVRVRRVRRKLRISHLKVKVRGRIAQAQELRRNGMKKTPITHRRTMDMRSHHRRTKNKNKELQNMRTKNRKNLMVMSGMDSMKRNRRNRNLPKITSRWSRLSSAL